ncbi:RNA polymerase subunit sigma [Corynebacterium yudongzhengii]|uniref:RNA polymerase subunit sigma n=1 Tax=Corynebacterium yudongzhengii TaxID=2080740 RepID=A0A2U1T4W4_9CORY|nr:sigma-70 family RNA polymerase sigma factor [Corynebacterium yudongzhengii]AWB82877.1 RNA polymerase subunit sigma [Corynebacterium yudongzhengii]PWC00928.1 RNA polymerase subunit sigma [Corynebacterium yudongzhengii]
MAPVFDDACPDDDHRTDDELVEDFLDGDVRAFRIIIERHRARLIAVARRYAANEDDAQDIMQETWLKASTSLDGYRAEAKLTTWLHRIVSNQGYDFVHHRSRRERPVLDEEDTAHRMQTKLSHTPHEHVVNTMLMQQILAKVPEYQRTALVLVDMLGHDVSSAARALGVRPGTVKSRRARARAVLQETVDV